MKRRTSFDLVFAIIYIIALHGASAPKIFVILCLNYQIATRMPKQFVTPATWAFNIGTLFANELCNGYRYADMLVFVTPSSHHAPWEDFVYSPTGAYIDHRLNGLIPRWEILFNITVLRLIAYNLDYLWSRDRGASSPLEVSQNRNCFVGYLLLMRFRRRTSIQRTSRKEIVLLLARSQAITIFAITWRTRYTHPYTSPARLSTSTTTSHSHAIGLPP